MAFETHEPFDLERIRKNLNIKPKSIDNFPIPISELEKIYDNYQANLSQLEMLRGEILATLNGELKGKVHSIRCRIKDADHLIEKIIRNVNCKPDKYKLISMENYNKIITDLIGVRIIILDKRDWKEVHQSLLKIFQNKPERYVVSPEDIITNYDKFYDEAMTERRKLDYSYHAEKPVVYITSEEDRNIYIDDNLKIDTSKSHYRSIHYIIRYGFAYFEIQVRTLFEEGWLEFDHRIKYPYDQNNKKKQEYASVLSNLAIAADWLISFYKESNFQQELSDMEQEEAEKEIAKEEDNSNLNLEDRMKLLF